MNIVSMLFFPLKFFFIGTKWQKGLYVNPQAYHVEAFFIL